MTMNSKFPIRKPTHQTAEIGVNLVSTIINDDFGWIFRKTHQEHDFGIDAYIDFVTPQGHVTGKFIAAQIKTGKSYLEPEGDVHWYSDTEEHLNYFLNLPTKTLLIICDPVKRECFWANLDTEKVDYRGGSWRHPIPKRQRLNIQAREPITELFGKIVNHIEDFQKDLDFLKSIDDTSFIQYSIPKTEIETLNFEKLKSFINRVTRNEKLTLAVQGKLYIATYGYERDSREVYQIPAIREWVQEATKHFNEWYLCAENNAGESTIAWLLACLSPSKASVTSKQNISKHNLIEGDFDVHMTFMHDCFEGLNEAADRWGWTDRYIREVSFKIAKEVFPGADLPLIKKTDPHK